jgi:hypothetical protein
MASRTERQKQQKREKKRLRDQKRQVSARQQRRSSKTTRIDKLAQLPLGECFASECWHEQGPPSVWAAISRRHPNGRIAAGIVHLDLHTKGILRAEVHPALPQGQLEARLGQYADGDALTACEPSLVAALIDAAQRMDTAPGQGRIAALDDVMALLEGVDGADCPHEIWTGPATASEERPPRTGLVERIKLWWGQK